MFSLPQGTEMFQFPWFPLLALCVQARVTPHDRCRVSPFGYLRIEAWSTAPRSFSQSPTSFIGSRRQGIHRWLFVAWKSKMLVLAMEFSRCVCRRRGCRLGRGRDVPGHRGTGTGPKEHPRASAAALRPQRVSGRVAPSKRNRRSRAPCRSTVGGKTCDGRACLGLE